MNILRHIAQLLLDINKVQAEVTLNIYGRLGIYRRLYVVCGFPEDVAARLEQQILTLGPKGIAEQHEILSRLVRGELGLKQLAEEWGQWFAGYMDHCHKLVLDEVRCAA